jgi:hypothetical protein
LGAADGFQTWNSARSNIGAALRALHYFQTNEDRKAKVQWLDQIVNTNVDLVLKSRGL